MKPLRALLLQASSLLFAGLACAAPQHAVTLYNEPPKYPANFKHFDYVNPDAPKGGIFRQGGLAASTASTRSSAKVYRPTTSA